MNGVNKKGFSLVELLVAIVILSVGMVATAAALARIQQMAQTGMERSLAGNLIRDLLAQVRLYYLASQPGAFVTYSQPVGTACAVADASWLCDTDNVTGDPSLGGYAGKGADAMEDTAMPYDIKDMSLSAPWCCPALPGAFSGLMVMPPSTCRTPSVNPAPVPGRFLFIGTNVPASGMPTTLPLRSSIFGADLVVQYDAQLEPDYSDRFDGSPVFGPFVACWRVADLADADDALGHDLVNGYSRLKKFQILLTWLQSGEGGGQFALVITERFGY